MSDFLTNLAARTIAAPSLRPRTRMRFEPAPELANADEASPAIASDRAPMGSESAAAVVDPAVPRALHPAQTEPVAPQTHPVPVPSAAPRRSNTVRAALPSGAEANESASSVNPAIADQAIEPSPAIETRVVLETVREPVRERRAVDTHEVPAVETVIERIAERPHRYDEQPPLVVREEIVRQERATVDVRAARPAPHTRAGTRRRQAESFAMPPAASEPVIPVVHVSIGRVEVRAVTPAAAPPAPPRRSSVMTIDDYVAKRKERS